MYLLKVRIQERKAMNFRVSVILQQTVIRSCVSRGGEAWSSLSHGKGNPGLPFDFPGSSH